MDPLQRRAKDIFHDALDASTAERTAVVASACGEDAALRAQVEALLQAHGKVGAFLSDATIGGSPDVSREKPGMMLGRYKLLEKIGEGGFGVVWMAEQREPVTRRVALKVIKLGMDTKNVIARFEAERQALALMEHPNIAKVFDGGATESGRPYFVMELVRGVPITEYCDAAQLSTEERLTLFASVCRAVQHAHQKGVIHRDLKPSNVLVTLQDGLAVPKVIDFGIAKATSAHLTERTLFTEFRQVIGTPEYMAPEQAELSGLDVDTRADIYSLGVLLYELLTGTKPFDMRTLLDKGWDEILRTIRDVDPERPSTRASSLGNQSAAIAAGRRLEPAQLGRLLRGDLDWIAMKALEKDRSRRYQTATALAEDIERHLADEPVSARPPSASYTLHKFLRRHRVAALAGTAIALALLFGAGAAAYGLLEARTERDRARTNEKTAVAELKLRTQTALFLGEMLRGVGPSVALGRDTTVLREILDATEKRVESELAGQPEVAASLQDIIGDVYRQIGSFEASERAHRAAIADWSRTPKPPQNELAKARGNLALALRELGRLDESERLQREVLAFWRASVDADSTNIALAANNLATTLITAGKQRDESLHLLEGAVAIWEKHPDATDGDASTALGNIAALYLHENDHARAAEYGRRALDSLSTRLSQDHVRVLTIENNLAVAYQGLGKFDEARGLLHDVLERELRVLGRKHVSTAAAYENLAMLERQSGDGARAAEAARQAASIQDELHAGDDPVRARTHALLARILLDLGQETEAEKEITLALDMRRRLFKSPDAALVESLLDLSDLCFDRGDNAGAERALREAVAMARVVHGPNSAVLGTALCSLGGALIRQKQPADAAVVLRESYAVSKRSPDAEKRNVATCGRNLAFTLNELGENAEALEVLNEILPVARDNAGPDWVKFEGTLQLRLSLQLKLDLNAAARETARELVANRRRALAKDDARITEILNFAAAKLADLGDLDGAEPLAREALSRSTDTSKAAATARTGVMVTLGSILSDASAVSGDLERATAGADMLREALTLRAGLLAADDWRMPYTQVLLGGALASQTACDTRASLEPRVARIAEAEALALPALAALEGSKTLQPELRAEKLVRARANVVRIYEVWHRLQPGAGKDAEADRYRVHASPK